MRLSDFALDRATQQMIESYSAGNSFPHTILIEGGTAQQRLSLARFIGSLLLCTGAGEKPCGVCAGCVKLNALSHPDLREYGDAESNSVFKVEVCREIRADCFIMPNDGDKKIYILKEAQNMNDSGENALLKILEEPPEYVHFLLTCPGRSSMLETVLSRATVLTLGETASQEAAYTQEAVQTALEICRALTQVNELALLRATAFEKDREAFKNTVLCLQDVFRDAMLVKTGGSVQSPFEGVPADLAAAFTAQRLYALYQAAEEIYDGAVMNQNHNLLMTSLCYKLRKAADR